MQLGGLVGGSAEVIGPEASLLDAAKAMIDLGIGSIGVVEGRNLVGILTERDLVRAVSGGADLLAEPVAKWMAQDPDVFPPDVDVEEAAQWLLEAGYRHMPIMEEGELLGIVSIRDILWAIVEG